MNAFLCDVGGVVGLSQARCRVRRDGGGDSETMGGRARTDPHHRCLLSVLSSNLPLAIYIYQYVGSIFRYIMRYFGAYVTLPSGFCTLTISELTRSIWR